eukprot:Pgem_evm1s12326
MYVSSVIQVVRRYFTTLHYITMYVSKADDLVNHLIFLQIPSGKTKANVTVNHDYVDVTFRYDDDNELNSFEYMISNVEFVAKNNRNKALTQVKRNYDQYLRSSKERAIQSKSL